MRPFRPLALAATLALVAAGALAQTRTIGTYGAWEAFGGTTNDGRPVCGVSTSWQDGRYVGIKYWQGEGHFTVQLIKRNWQIPSGTRVPVSLQFDQLGPWTATASGYPATSTAGSFIEFTVPFARLDGFLREFRTATTAAVSFPSGNEPMWRMNLNGSNAASQAMTDCVARLGGGGPVAGKGAATQPFASGPTQPFGAAPAPVPGLAPAPQTPTGSKF